jgi:hypothetical protein
MVPAVLELECAAELLIARYLPVTEVFTVDAGTVLMVVES